MSFIMFTSRFAVFVTCFAALELDHVLSIEEVFFIVGYYQILRHTMTVNFPQGIANLAEFQVAVERIRTFLLLPESNVGDPTPYCPNWKETPMYANFQKQELLYDDDQRLELENVTVRIDGKDVLHEVNACVQPGKLTMIVGEVGSGKSCMLHAMMCEMDPVRGRIYKQGILSYASQEPWLFAGSVKQNIIFGHEFDRTRYQEVINLCALTRDLTLLPYGDSTVVGERGISLSGGQRARVNLARAIYKEADIYLLDDPLSAVDPSVSRHLFEKLITGYLKNKIVVLATHQLQFLKSAPQIIVMKGGRVEMVGTFADFQNSGMDFVKFADQKAPEESSIDHATAEIVHSISKKDIAKDHVNGPDSAERIMGPVMPGYKLYLGYFGAGGNVLLIFLVIFLFALSQVFISGADFFMNEWIQSEERVMLLKTAATSNYEQFCDDYCIYMFSGSIGLLTVVSLSRSYYFYYFCLRASRTLHRKMFLCIVRTRMWFFNVNPSGRILNRFSKDLGTVDEFLPNSFLDFVQLFLNMVGTVIIFVIVSPWLMIPSIVLTAIFFGIRHYYMKTCRSIKRLEGSTKSPVYSHLNASLQGLATIRMHEMEDILVEEFDKYQDDHSSAFWMFTVTSRAFGYIMDFIVLLYIVLISTYFFLIPSGNKMDAGLCITQCMGLTGLFQWGMRQSTELENLLTSVERVIEYTKLDIEPALKSEKGKEPPPDWPQFGRIVMENLSMNYNVMEPPVLKNLNIVINPKEKIGIVGRTGAGKSSLIGALFRLAYIHGEIYIDDIETGTIGLHDLRRKISIIPQEPILFTGTMRSNLDPFGEYKDEDLFKALLAVELKCALTMGETALDMHMAEGGVNFSVGERQLVCLARAIVRNNRILILDEATANVDPQTDKFIQTTIRKSFAECTVLTVAHRLLTIIDSDRVLVMDAGRCVEFDHPFILMSNSQSFFAQMVDKSGPGNAALYKQMAAVGFTGLQDAEEDDGDGDEDNGEQFQEDD